MKQKLGKWKYLLMNNRMLVRWGDVSLTFYIEGNRDVSRAQSFNKEKDTIKWIDGFKQSDVFWDIGANVGVYSLYAAKKIACKVCAFEPVFHNFNALNRNIILNNLQNNITAFCIAINDTFMVDEVHIPDLNSGSARSSFNTDTGGLQTSSQYIFHQGCVGFSIDELVKYLPFPNYIKVDVDGNELLVLDGMEQVLCDDRFNSLLIEINGINVIIGDKK